MRDRRILVLENILRQPIGGYSFSRDVGHAAYTDFRIWSLASEKKVMLEGKLAGRKLCADQLVRCAPCRITSIGGMYRSASNQCNAAEKGKKSGNDARRYWGPEYLSDNFRKRLVRL